MEQTITKFPKHVCQHCGSKRKWVETVIDDEFVWNERREMYLPNGFSDLFEHTGVERCVKREEEWTGA